MIRVTAKDSETELEMSGSGADLAKELHRIVRHISKKLLEFCEPEKRRQAAEILATGMTFAVREGYDDARKDVYNDTENADVAP